MKIISWNVNGIRAAMKNGFADFIKKEKADIYCLQEIKISEKDIHLAAFNFKGYAEFWYSATRPGYSGTAILIRDNLVKNFKIKNGLGKKEFDEEGRTQILEAKKFILINNYFPNSGPELKRLDYKIAYNNYLTAYAKKLASKKPVLICGDFNVAHHEIDLARPKDNEGSAGFTKEERAGADKLEKSGFVDSFRRINGEKIQYSWWSIRTNARARNVGWRIDYFFISKNGLKYLKNAFILDKIQGSDHCPVGVELDDF